MTRLLVGAGLAAWLGVALLLSGTRRFSRLPLDERLRPQSAPSTQPTGPPGVLEAAVAVLGPLARSAGDRLAAVAGVSEELEARLRRVHAPLDVTSFRLRQLGWALVGLLGGLLVALAGVPAPVAVFAMLGAPILAFLLVEQQLARRSEAWQRSLARELPVVSEQLAMLLNAGWSLGAALGRLAERGRGCVAADLAVVTGRVRQGVPVEAALREWAQLARVDAVDRLVAVVSLDRQAADLGRLVSAEARQARRDLHRVTLELLERRGQQVWIPVTVATLVPGAILLAVPFLAALRLFSNA
ncbi:MAG TPA: type II secretion system F family protein [Acidimicrobiales bacterium]|nr:type II secretion system F family protein [Acidimicrobiales bacterium]